MYGQSKLQPVNSFSCEKTLKVEHVVCPTTALLMVSPLLHMNMTTSMLPLLPLVNSTPDFEDNCLMLCCAYGCPAEQ